MVAVMDGFQKSVSVRLKARRGSFSITLPCPWALCNNGIQVCFLSTMMHLPRKRLGR